MLIDPLTFLIAHRRAKDANLSSSETLKATLLGSAVGGGNTATSVFFADRTIKQKIEATTPIVTEPASCMDTLVSAFETFLGCMENDMDNAEKLKDYKNAFREFCKHMVIKDPERKRMIKAHIEAVCKVPPSTESSTVK